MITVIFVFTVPARCLLWTQATPLSTCNRVQQTLTLWQFSWTLWQNLPSTHSGVSCNMCNFFLFDNYVSDFNDFAVKYFHSGIKHSVEKQQISEKRGSTIRRGQWRDEFHGRCVVQRLPQATDWSSDDRRCWSWRGSWGTAGNACGGTGHYPPLGQPVSGLTSEHKLVRNRFFAPFHQTPSRWIALLFVARARDSKVSLLAGYDMAGTKSCLLIDSPHTISVCNQAGRLSREYYLCG